MTEQPHIPAEVPPATDFTTITQRITDMEHEYVSNVIGQDAMLRELDERKMSFEAIVALNDEEFLKFTADEQRLLEEGALNPQTQTDILSDEFNNILKATIGPFDDFELAYVTPGGITIHKSIEPTENNPVGILVLSMQLTKKGGVIARKHLAMDTTPLTVTLEDIVTLNKFVAALKKFKL